MKRWISDDEIYTSIKETNAEAAEEWLTVTNIGYGFNAAHFLKNAVRISKQFDLGYEFFSVREDDVGEFVEWLVIKS